jgi:hypothetical protein
MTWKRAVVLLTIFAIVAVVVVMTLAPFIAQDAWMRGGTRAMCDAPALHVALQRRDAGENASPPTADRL